MSEIQANTPNAAQRDAWNGRPGETWAQFQEQLDRQLDPLGEAALAALEARRGERIIDIGCGGGHTTLELARRVGSGGEAVGVDLSAPLLEVARRRAAAAPPPVPKFLMLDAQIDALGSGAYDAAYSRFGVMFFSDPVAGFRNIRAALKSGGRLSFVCWRTFEENPLLAEPLRAALPLIPPPAPMDPGAPGPFALADAQRVHGILAQAGFDAIDIRPHDALVGGGSLEQSLALSLRIGPLGAVLREHPELAGTVTAAVQATLAAHQTARGVLMGAAVWIVRARAP